MLPVMEPQNAARGWANDDPTMSNDPAYEDSWYRVLKRLSEEGASDAPDRGSDDGGTG